MNASNQIIVKCETLSVQLDGKETVAVTAFSNGLTHTFTVQLVRTVPMSIGDSKTCDEVKFRDYPDFDFVAIIEAAESHAIAVGEAP